MERIEEKHLITMYKIDKTAVQSRLLVRFKPYT